MAAPADDRTMRDLAERLALALVGAVALTGERAERLAEDLADKGGIRRDDAREAVGELASRWRGDATRLSERTGSTLASLFRDLGLMTREEYEELELRVAQLEHRLRLLEGEQPPVSH
jgi:polyhydroxyalkanoate synthesis regulator phasin